MPLQIVGVGIASQRGGVVRYAFDSLLRTIALIFPVLLLYLQWRKRKKEFGGLKIYATKNLYLMLSEIFLAIEWLYSDMCYARSAPCAKMPKWSEAILLIGVLVLSLKAMRGPGQGKQFIAVMLVLFTIAIFVP